MNHRKGQFYFIFKTQCILPPPCPISGAAYFGITSSDNPFYGQDGNFPYAGEGKRLLDAVRQYGADNFRVSMEGVGAETDFSKAKARLDAILSQVRGHPLCLNHENPNPGPVSEEHREHLSIALMDNLNAIAHVVSEDVKPKMDNRSGKKLKWICNRKSREEMQIQVGEDVLEGFHFGRLTPKERKKGPKKKRLDISKMSDAERARLPEFILTAIKKQGSENV